MADHIDQHTRCAKCGASSREHPNSRCLLTTEEVPALVRKTKFGYWGRHQKRWV
jgi:hypothetical protein